MPVTVSNSTRLLHDVNATTNHRMKLGNRTIIPIKLFPVLIVSVALVAIQIVTSLKLKHVISDAFIYEPPPITKSNSRIPVFDQIPRLGKNESVGACLMIKEDNDLLYEWIAYHYTVLPLRYLYVGSDEGNMQDPDRVLGPWKVANTGLEYWIANASSFMHRHGKAERKEDSHHSFVRRQRGFISTCTEFMKAQGLRWVTYIDSDEFLVMNRFTPADGNYSIDPNIDQTALTLRQALPKINSNTTFLEAIFELDKIKALTPCITMPRVLYGALENVSCSEATSVVDMAKSSFPYEEMSTLRFNLHAQKGDFAKSKFGKVMMDVSNLSDATIAKPPRNIHRPYLPECGPGVIAFPEALFYLNHYIGSWERYSSRQDGRRNRVEWEKRAYITVSDSCDQATFQWFPEFIKSVGFKRAQYLLGMDITSKPEYR